MSATKRGGNGKGGESEDPGVSRLDQVRELLFGEQARDLDQKLSDLENRLSKKLADLQTEVTKRFEAAEKSNKAMFDALTVSLDREAESRVEGSRQMGLDLARAASELAQKLEDLDGRSHASLTQVEQQLSSRAATLKAEIESLAAASNSALSAAAGDLGNRKADRADLAAMFTDIAARLAAEPRKKG